MPRKSAKNRPAKPATDGGPQRLQRVLAGAGFGSRRQCEELIEDGRVHVDGVVVTKLGTSADPSKDKILVDGLPLKKQKLVYFVVNKPVGVVTTNRDPQGRPRVVDLVPPDERVFPVGRLDRSSEGLIILTNDGELAQRLTHPKFGVQKVYRVIVAGRVETETMKKMRTGMYIAEGFVNVDGAKLIKARPRATELEITLREGKNREIRRILARLGHKVQQLRRIAVGPVRLGDVPAGAYRVLRREEVDKLWRSIEAAEKAAVATAPTKKKKKVGVKRPTSTRYGVKPVGSRTSASSKKTARPASSDSKTASRKTPAAKAATKKATGGAKFTLPRKTPTSGAVIGGDVSVPKPENPDRINPNGRDRSKSTRSKSSRSKSSRVKSARSGSGNQRRGKKR